MQIRNVYKFLPFCLIPENKPSEKVFKTNIKPCTSMLTEFYVKRLLDPFVRLRRMMAECNKLTAWTGSIVQNLHDFRVIGARK